MEDLLKRLSSTGSTVYSVRDVSNMIRRNLIIAMKEGRFSDALPAPYLKEIETLATECIADGHQRMMVQLILEDRGLASFIYELDTTPTGVSISSAREWFVPKKSSDRKMPRHFDGIPRVAIDVSAL